MYKDFNDLGRNIASQQKTLVVAAAHDSHTLEAVFKAAEKYNLRYLLVGNRGQILAKSLELGFSPGNDLIVNCEDDAGCTAAAVDLIKTGSGDVLMKGIMETSTLLKAVLDKDSGIRGPGTLSHMAVLEVPGYHKLIGITDGGMIPNPDLSQKVDIVKNAVRYFRGIGCTQPKIAALCASETVIEKIQETVDASKLQEMCNNGELGNCLLEGPVSFDIAVSRESAAIKGFSSEISGETDIFLVPCISAGNILAKGLIYWAHAKMAGLVLGSGVPIVLVSRAASSEEKLLSILISIAG